MAFRRYMRPIPLSKITLTDAFWAPRQSTLVEVTLPQQFEQIVATGRLANFEKVNRGETEGHKGIIFDDSDLYKWLEACAYALATKPDAKLQTLVNQATTAIERAQDSDGYLFTYYQLQPDRERRWRNLGSNHEMYCCGHLVEGAVAMFECTGDRRLLDVAIKFVDHVMSIFGPDKRKGYCGHEELELALIRLADCTGEEKYRAHARWMVETRGTRPSPFEAERNDPVASNERYWGPDLLKEGEVFDGEYYQDHAPIREHDQVVGHAVRAMYLYIAAAQLVDDEELQTALQRCWDNLVLRRMYVTGGIGPSRHNEGFTHDFDLPNLSAYAETCAAIGLVFWGRAMLELTGDAAYVETIERALFNGVLAGISLSGDRYFYDNPLESRGNHNRVPWFGCACCPPNIARLIGSVSNYLLSESEDSVYLHIPAALRAETKFGPIEIEANYPWTGQFKVRYAGNTPTKFALKVRIPDWTEEMETDLPGAKEGAEFESGYAVFNRVWEPGDSLTVDLGMEPKWIESDPRVLDNLGRLALTRGPLVYCAEEADLGFAPQLLSVDPESDLTIETDKKLGVTSMTTEGFRVDGDFPDGLYAPDGTSEETDVSVKMIPYYAWNNRGANHMQVWLRSL